MMCLFEFLAILVVSFAKNNEKLIETVIIKRTNHQIACNHLQFVTD